MGNILDIGATVSTRRLDSPALDDPSGMLLYEPFYGLSEKPFSLSTDPRFLFKSPSHAPVFQQVLSGIRRREGLMVLTGEIGMGKTTLCRSVLGSLDRKTFSAFVPDPFVTREDLLKILLVEFGVVSVEDLVRGRLQGASRAELSYPLYDFLRALEPLDAFAVLLLDEAQNLPSTLLEEIRILSDLEGTRKLLQVVLIGQPELSEALRQPHMRQMRQRVTTHCELLPLSRQGVYGYVAHRLAVAGATADRLQFTGDALDLVFEATGGVPRVINRLCDRTLQRGHEMRTKSIGPDVVRAAVHDLQLVVTTPPAFVPSALFDSFARESAPVFELPVRETARTPFEPSALDTPPAPFEPTVRETTPAPSESAARDITPAASEPSALGTAAAAPAPEPLAPALAPAPSLPLAAVLAAAAGETAPAGDAKINPEPEPAADEPTPVPSVEIGPAIPSEATMAGLDDLRALLSARAAAIAPAAPKVAPPRADRTPQPRLGTLREPRRHAPRSRARAVATAALVVLGALSGSTLAAYWLWAGPLLTERIVMPAVDRPSPRIGAPLPAVLPPAIDFSSEAPVTPGQDGGSVNVPAGGAIAPAIAPATAPVADAVWVVQVGAFVDDGRADVLIGQLADRGLRAFRNSSATRGGATLYVVMVGPYPTRDAARAGLEVAAQVPGVGEPILQPVPPASAVLR
jgi:general secretion pathway protein A